MTHKKQIKLNKYLNFVFYLQLQYSFALKFFWLPTGVIEASGLLDILW